MSVKFKVSLQQFFLLSYSPHFMDVSSVMVVRLTLAAVPQFNPVAVSDSTKYLEHVAWLFSSPRTETISN